MTRQSAATGGPQFQILYLPKSAVADDFTVFDWSDNIADVDDYDEDKFFTFFS
jgi:hypothetical protein